MTKIIAVTFLDETFVQGGNKGTRFRYIAKSQEQGGNKGTRFRYIAKSQVQGGNKRTRFRYIAKSQVQGGNKGTRFLYIAKSRVQGGNKGTRFRYIAKGIGVSLLIYQYYSIQPRWESKFSMTLPIRSTHLAHIPVNDGTWLVSPKSP